MKPTMTEYQKKAFVFFQNREKTGCGNGIMPSSSTIKEMIDAKFINRKWQPTLLGHAAYLNTD